MITLAVQPKTMEVLARLRGETPDEKILALVESYLSSQIQTCEREIAEYEIKHRATFADFAEAWAQNQIQGKHTHAIERDYMEWEGLEAEKRQWLAMLKQLPPNGHDSQ